MTQLDDAIYDTELAVRSIAAIPPEMRDDRQVAALMESAERLASAVRRLVADPRDVTLATIRGLVRRELDVPVGMVAGAPHARGRRAAMADIQAVLDMHGKPPAESVMLGG